MFCRSQPFQIRVGGSAGFDADEFVADVLERVSGRVILGNTGPDTEEVQTTRFLRRGPALSFVNATSRYGFMIGSAVAGGDAFPPRKILVEHA